MTRTLTEREILYLRDALARCAEEDQNRLENEAGDLDTETEGRLHQRSKVCRELQSLIEDGKEEVILRIPKLEPVV
jgi:hypothetical protein